MEIARTAMRRTTACLDFILISCATAYNFPVKSSSLIRPRPRPKRSGPLTLQGPWVRSAVKGPVFTPDPQLCCSASAPAQLCPHNCVNNFPASRLTSKFVWNVKTQTSEFCALVSDTSAALLNHRERIIISLKLALEGFKQRGSRCTINRT